MSLDADMIVDRRRMRRKLTTWRVLAVMLAIGAVAALAFAMGGNAIGVGAKIARIEIRGLIRNDQNRVEALDKLAKSNFKAVIVHIDSPGGTTAGSEQLFDALRQLSQKKPMVVVIDGLAASGAYIAAMSSEHIIAQSSSLVGSIGVLVQYPNVGDLLKTLGIKVEEVKSTPLKAAPNGFEPTTPEVRAALQSLVMDSYAWFKDLVKERRHMDDTTLQTVSDGRVFTGRQALPLKLIDQIGNEATARAWLAKEKNVPATTPVVDYELRSRLSDLSFVHLTATLFRLVGLSALAEQVEGSATVQALERLNLDGLLALWHPPLAN